MHILGLEESLEYFLENPKSFCRFGDGEINLIRGLSIPFQAYDEKLALRLKEILASSNEKCYVGIISVCFHSHRHMDKFSKNFHRLYRSDFSRILTQFANKKRLYLNAAALMSFSARIAKSSEQEKLNHFEKIKTLFKDRKLVIISGSTVFDKIQYNIFEKAKERVHIFANSKNAWSQYAQIMDYARKFSKDWTLCFILGPTATVLAYDLAQEGYMAWDIGHVAKLYDAFMKEGGITNIYNFFAPD